MGRRASEAFESWVREAVAPIAHDHGLAGRGPVFRRRAGIGWIVFGLERHRLDPGEAAALAGDPRIEFRFNLGVAIPSLRPAWRAGRDRPPGMLDLDLRSPSRALEPPEDEFWHVFDADDPGSRECLTALTRRGLADALAAIGDTSASALLARRLAVAGPLESLSPGAAEYLLALAGAAGDVEVRGRIAEALQREPVPDERDRMRREFLEGLAQTFGPEIRITPGLVPAPGAIWPPIRPPRRTAPTRDRLLADATSESANTRRIAVAKLGGWDHDPAVVDVLQRALTHPDAYTRLSAVSSLGHVGDADPGTWRRALALAEEAEAGPREIGQAIVLLAKLDAASRRADALAALERMVERYPAWTRDLKAFGAQLA